jgi:hypothetical protein
LCRAGEYGFGARAVAAQIMRQTHDAVEIGAGRLVFGLIIAITFVVPIVFGF